jgi:hypothetical protein
MFHIFFPRRLEIVVEKQQPNRFSPDPWHQSPLDGLLSHQLNVSPSDLAHGFCSQAHDLRDLRNGVAVVQMAQGQCQ